MEEEFKKKLEENKFYIYLHINPVKNEVFYVGKGCRKRAWSKRERNQYWHNTVKKYNYIVDVIEEGLTNEEAIKREIFYIAKIGRKDLGKGPLVNFTNGGEGAAGIIVSKETREKQSKAGKGRKQTKEHIEKRIKPLIGKKISDKQKLAISKAQTGKKQSEQQREKTSERLIGNTYNLGKKHSEERVKQHSEDIKGEKNPMFGKLHSEESRLKMKAAQKDYQERIRQEKLTMIF